MPKHARQDIEPSPLTPLKVEGNTSPTEAERPENGAERSRHAAVPDATSPSVSSGEKEWTGAVIASAAVAGAKAFAEALPPLPFCPRSVKNAGHGHGAHDASVPTPSVTLVGEPEGPRSSLTGRPYFSEAKPWLASLPKPALGVAACALVAAVGLGVLGVTDAAAHLASSSDARQTAGVATTTADANERLTAAERAAASYEADSAESSADASATPEERLALAQVNAEAAGLSPDLGLIGALPASTEPFAFNLAPDAGTDIVTGATPLPDDTYAALTEALAAFTDWGNRAGFLLVDLGTGRGIAAGLDEAVYGASSIKAPYVLYLCQTALASGEATFDTLFSEDAALDAMDGPYLTDGVGAYPLMTLAEDAIVRSDNDSYRILRANGDDNAFAAWLADGNAVDADVYEWFPQLSPRSLGQLWTRMGAFFATDTEEAWWLETQCQLTEVSFMRAALFGTGDWNEVVVADKAGWIADDDPAFCAMTDGGIVSYGGRSYLLCAVTDAPYCEEWETAFTGLIRTVFAAREALA